MRARIASGSTVSSFLPQSLMLPFYAPPDRVVGAAGNLDPRGAAQSSMLAPLAFLTLLPLRGAPSAVVRAEGFELFLAAPQGWTIETAPSRDDGLPAVVVRRGESFRTARNVMFLNLDRREAPSLPEFIANRRAFFLKDRPAAKVRPAGKALAGDGSPATLLDFDDPKIPQFERRAYLTTADGIVTLFLQCASPQARTVHSPAFKALVESFRDLHAPHPR